MPQNPLVVKINPGEEVANEDSVEEGLMASGAEEDVAVEEDDGGGASGGAGDNVNAEAFSDETIIGAGADEKADASSAKDGFAF